MNKSKRRTFPYQIKNQESEKQFSFRPSKSSTKMSKILFPTKLKTLNFAYSKSLKKIKEEEEIIIFLSKTVKHFFNSYHLFFCVSFSSWKVKNPKRKKLNIKRKLIREKRLFFRKKFYFIFWLKIIVFSWERDFTVNLAIWMENETQFVVVIVLVIYL